MNFKLQFPKKLKVTQDLKGLLHQEFKGTVIKTNPENSIPRKIAILWMTVMSIIEGSSFELITESNQINDTNFKISVRKSTFYFLWFLQSRIFQINETVKEFNKRLAIHPEVLEMLPNQEREKARKFRFAMGWIIGLDFLNGTSKEGLPGFIGPKGEKATAENQAVFYKNGTFDDHGCLWFNQVPQGFSCAIVSPTIPEIPDCSEAFERFEIISCDEIVLKILK